jgi:hypothetical protein
MLVIAAALIGGIVLAVVIAVRLFEAGAISPDASPIDQIFASRIVVFAIRVAILFAALYGIVSAVALIVQRRWPSQVGPLQISEGVRALRNERDDLRHLLGLARQEIEGLQAALKNANEDIDRYRDDLEVALAEVDRLAKRRE